MRAIVPEQLPPTLVTILDIHASILAEIEPGPWALALAPSCTFLVQGPAGEILTATSGRRLTNGELTFAARPAALRPRRTLAIVQLFESSGTPDDDSQKGK